MGDQKEWIPPQVKTQQTGDPLVDLVRVGDEETKRKFPQLHRAVAEVRKILNNRGPQMFRISSL